MAQTTTARSTKMAEFLGLVSFAGALMLLISLATYDPRDPALFFRAGASGAPRNFIGPMGAFLAELLIPQLFGMAAHVLPIVLGVLGWKLFWCKPIEAPYTKVSGIVLLMGSLTALFTLTFGTFTMEGEPVRAGGAVGELATQMLVASFDRTGSYIILATSVFVALILATQFSFAAFLSAVGRIAAERWRGVVTTWARLSEARRKEKMRREVLKKHAQREREKDPSPESLPRVRKVKAAGAAESGDPGHHHALA